MLVVVGKKIKNTKIGFIPILKLPMAVQSLAGRKRWRIGEYMFKEITAIFKVSEDTAFINGNWKKDRSHFLFEVKRMLSGAFAYGDRSCHSVIITNVPESFPYHFDTRYDDISAEKETWVKFWKDWIEDRFELKVELSEYKENEVEITE